MVGESTFQRGGPRRRGLFGFLILGIHAGIVFLFALSMRAPLSQAESPPVTVEFLEDQPARLDPPPRQPDPKLAAIAPPLVVPVPEMSVSVETEVHSEVVAESPTPPAPIALAAAGDSGDAAALTDVAYLEPPSPRYPPESKHAREEGLVILKVLIDESGHASRINVYRSSGHPRLDEEARKAVQRAVFKPYLDGGVARAAVALIPVEFSLHGAGDRGRRNG